MYFVMVGGFHYGTLDRAGLLNSENGTYLYPDLVMGYTGVFIGGRMVGCLIDL